MNKLCLTALVFFGWASAVMSIVGLDEVASLAFNIFLFVGLFWAIGLVFQWLIEANKPEEM